MIRQRPEDLAFTTRNPLPSSEPTPQLAWRPCHLPSRAEIVKLTDAERLWAVQQTLTAFGFESLADVLLTELSLDGIGVGRRTSRFFRGGACVRLLIAISGHSKFNIHDLLGKEEFVLFAKDFIGTICDYEFNRLVLSKKLQRRLFDFKPAHFEDVAIFKEIESEQWDLAPVFTSVIQRLARVEIGRDYPADVRASVPDICDGTQEKVVKALRNRRLISIVAVQLLAYAHTKQCNLMQGILGIYLYACNTPKRTIETLHQFGLCCGYTAILQGLRATAKVAMNVLVERTHNQRFCISYDNMNFYKHVRDQRSHNRAHQTNYTAGYILFLDGDKQLPSTSVDHAACLNVDIRDLLPSSEFKEYLVLATEYNIGRTIRRYCRNAMAHQKDLQGSPLYTLCDSPLSSVRANQDRADYMTFPTLDQDEASIDGTIAVLKDLIKLLDPTPQDVEGNTIMLNGDYLTVRNVTRAIFRRQEHPQTIHNFSCFEPVAGLFHLQMNALKMLLHAFEGGRTDPGSLLRFASLLRRKSVGKEVKDFHGCNEFFNHVFDAHILAIVMKEVGAASLAELQAWLRKNDWRKVFRGLSVSCGEALAVEIEHVKMLDSIQVEVDQRISKAMEEQEELKRQRALERREKGTNAAPLPAIDWKREEGHLQKKLSTGVWDTVWQNARLLTIAGLVYRDFSDACRNGYSGRVEKCVETLMLMFQGSRFKNYAGKCLHLVLCLKKAWKPEFRDVWLKYSLIRPTPKQNYWCATDRHGETIIRGNKDKVRPSANAQGDEFLRDVIGPNIPSLEAVKQMVYQASGASSYGDHHHEVDSYADVAQVCATLVQEDVFSFKRGRGTSAEGGNLVEGVVDLFAEGIGRISTGAPVREYKKRSRAKWGSETWDRENNSIWEELDALEGGGSSPGVLEEN